MNKLRIFFFTLTMGMIAAVIGWIFWDQELKYSLPTPVPVNFRSVKIGEKTDLVTELPGTQGAFTLLHFYNPDCPCSRFNIKEFEELSQRYKDRISFYAIIQSEDDEAAENFIRKYDLKVPAVLDRDGSISDKCGIYATPQAVLLDNNSVIYFKGNYNTARYCTRKETKFAELAIIHLLKREPLPLYIRNAVTEPYGCSLPSDEAGVQQAGIFDFFKGIKISILWKP